MVGKFVAEQRYQFQAPPARVFAALTEPRRLEEWFLSHAEVDLRRGGSFAFDWLGGYHMESTVLEVRKGRSLTLHWVDAGPKGKPVVTRVAFQVTKKGDGAVLALRHSGFTSPAHYAECSSRWAYYLTNLKSVLDHGADLRSPGDW